MIAIVDTGGANIASVKHALTRLGETGELTRDFDEISKASHVIFPGVGAALDSMNRLRAADLVEKLATLKQPTLGICLGMQLLFDSSDEGPTSCLGILPGNVTRFPIIDDVPVPHMGWNQVKRSKAPTPLLEGIPDGTNFYFVHSFIVPGGDWEAGQCDYGVRFPAMIASGNFHGAQFHPERSGEAGARLLRNFLSL